MVWVYLNDVKNKIYYTIKNIIGGFATTMF